jgi:copper(I)-binding protein
LTTAEPDYAWVNRLQIWARGTVDLDKGEAHVMGYLV